MALMALGKYARLSAAQRKPISGRVTWSEGEHLVDFLEQPQVGVRFGEPLPEEPPTRTNLQTFLRRALTAPLVSTSSSRVSLENKGAGPIFFSWKSEGVPADGQIEEGDRRVKILRTFLDADGKAVDPLNLAQGGLIVVKWTLSASETVDNLVIEDLLPAGLEVENASLKTSQSLPWIEAQTTLKPLHVDIRDDRVIAFTGPFAGERNFFYVARAVTRGEFKLPPIHAECMYDPGIRSARGAGVVRVAEKSE
jgi:hypothetical protein